ncbi:MAG: 30S ribosomal protein S9 [Dehalococcoidia bacterium]
MTQQQYYYATGRRKTAVARVRIYTGSGAMIINGKPLEEIFTRPTHQRAVLLGLRATNTQSRFNVQVKVAGGGISGWAGAISHGIARALVSADETQKPTLRHLGLLTRDSRMRESKHYGLKRARKAPQYTKR